MMRTTQTNVAIDARAERALVEAELETLLAPTTVSDCVNIQEAMRYAVLGGGKRVRPILSLRVAETLDNLNPLTVRAAAGVELYHCASLVIDDLPCMDNEYERRGRPTVHIQFGEANAVLAAFGLVALASRSIMELAVSYGQLASLIQFQNRLLRTLDCSGLIAGQARDLALRPEDGFFARAEVNEMKTVPLFELAVEAGAVGKELSGDEGERLRAFGREYGRAFQLVDDLLDGDLSSREPFLRHLDSARQLIAGFGAGRHRLFELLDYLHAYAEQKDHCHR